MDRRLPIYIVILIILTRGTSMSAKDLSFRHYDVTDGLSENTVNCISQDHRGFMWFGTNNGLNRFDGTSFKVYNFLSDNVIKSLYPDKERLWIGTGKALYFLDFNTDSIISPKILPFNDLCYNDTGAIIDIVKCGDRIFLLDAAGRILSPDTCIMKHPSILSSQHWHTIASLNDRYILGISTEGMSVINPTEATIVSHMSKTHTDIPMDLFYADSMAVVTYGNDKRTECFMITSDYRIKPTYEMLYPAADIAGSHNNSILLGTNGQGIYSTYGTKWFNTANSNLSGNVVTSIFTDRDGNLWVGTYRDGINFHSPVFRWFDRYTIDNGVLSHKLATAIMKDGPILYIGTDGGGLDIYNIEKRRLTNLNTGNSDIIGDDILSMIQDGGDILMISYTKGISRFSPLTGKFVNYPLKNALLWCLSKDPDGKIWALGKDISVFDQATGAIKALEHDVTASCIGFSKQEAWVATSGHEIYVYHRRSFKQLRHILQGQDIRTFFIDSHGNKWIGIKNRGLSILSDLDSIMTFGPDNGFTASNVVSIQEDTRCFLWIATDNGLFRYNPTNRHFRRFGEYDGLPATFLSNSSHKTDSILYFGSNQGVVKVNSSYINFNNISTPVVIDKISFSGSDTTIVLPDSNMSVELPSNLNSPILHFSHPAFISPENIRYDYTLEGYGNQWHKIGPDHKISLPNLPYGNYTLRIRFRDSNGNYNKNISSVSIYIVPPWWRSRWGVTMCAILLSLAIYLLYRTSLHFKNIKKKAREEERKNAFEHAIEIKTPITDIVSTDKKLMDRVLDAIDRNLSNAGYSVDELSMEAGISRTNLFKKIQSLTGMTPAALIRSIRLKKASRLLIESKLNISEISDAVGFGNIKYFNKYFKEEYGMTPSRYRAEHCQDIP